MNMSFFEYVIEVDRTRSITQAAENLFMAQPNLSKAIKEAENTLGYTLFERTSKGVCPTAKGILFIEYAREVVQQFEKIKAIGKFDKPNMQNLSISIPRSNYIARSLIDFIHALDKSETIDLEIEESDSVQTIHDVADGKFSLGIIQYQVIHEKYFLDYLQEKKLSSELIHLFDCLVLISAENALAGQNAICPDDLWDFIEILNGETLIPYLGKSKDSTTFAINKHIHLNERTNQLEALSSIQNTFMLSAPTPQNILDRYHLAQCKFDSPANAYKELFIYQDGHPFSEMEKKFLDQVYGYKIN